MTYSHYKKDKVNSSVYLIILSHFNNCKGLSQKKKKELYEQNFNLASESDKECELGENPYLPQHERDKHKQTSEELKARALEVREEYNRVTKLTEYLARKLNKNIDSYSYDESDS
jgi:hypothetical protein